jgi:hypothetical protein
MAMYLSGILRRSHADWSSKASAGRVEQALLLDGPNCNRGTDFTTVHTTYFIRDFPRLNASSHSLSTMVRASHLLIKHQVLNPILITPIPAYVYLLHALDMAHIVRPSDKMSNCVSMRGAHCD